MSYVHDPVHWRNRARSMHMFAEKTNNIDAKAMMVKLAEDYEKLGDRAEARVKQASSKAGLPALDFRVYQRQRHKPR